MLQTSTKHRESQVFVCRASWAVDEKTIAEGTGRDWRCLLAYVHWGREKTQVPEPQTASSGYPGPVICCGLHVPEP